MVPLWIGYTLAALNYKKRESCIGCVRLVHFLGREQRLGQARGPSAARTVYYEISWRVCFNLYNIDGG